jgi:hypothetical protein
MMVPSSSVQVLVHLGGAVACGLADYPISRWRARWDIVTFGMGPTNVDDEPGKTWAQELRAAPAATPATSSASMAGDKPCGSPELGPGEPCWDEGRSMSSGCRRGHYDMTLETLQASTIIAVPAEAVFAVLADPASHRVIDGTGWVSKALDAASLTGSGQMFRMAMYHANHPNGSYEMTNRVAVFDPPRAISWEPGKTSQATGSRSSADGPGATIWSPPTLPALRSRSPTTGPRSRRSYASTSRSRRSP